VPTWDKPVNGSGTERTAQADRSHQPDTGQVQRPEARRPGVKTGHRPGVRRVRQATEWGRKKYAGSVAEDLWRRLAAMDVINQGMLFAATLLLCLFPFLIVASALAGRPVVTTLTRYTGLNGQAAADAGHLFAS
jgi:membrane protein